MLCFLYKSNFEPICGERFLGNRTLGILIEPFYDSILKSVALVNSDLNTPCGHIILKPYYFTILAFH